MYDLKSTQVVCDARPDEQDTYIKIEWLKSQLACEDEPSRLKRAARIEAEKSLMLNPVSTPQAFAFFGTLLGLLPPAAIFYRLFGYGIFKGALGAPTTSEGRWLMLLCLGMNIVCCLVGRMTGRKIGGAVEWSEKLSWGWMLVVPAMLGILWGIITGGLGGLLFFIIGAVGGVFFGASIGALAFALFTPFHRMFTWDGMIDSRHLGALLFGVIGAIVSLIVSPAFIPY